MPEVRFSLYWEEEEVTSDLKTLNKHGAGGEFDALQILNPNNIAYLWEACMYYLF